MKKILITGAAGFIGSHLTDFYLKKRYKVIGIDNLMTGSLENIEHLKKNKNFVIINHDIRYKIDVNEPLDFILHFASPASPVDYLKFPIDTLQIGSIGTENVLDLALKNNAKIVVASSSEVYGDPLEHPQIESYYGNVNPIGPRGVYDEAKRYLEALTTAYHNNKKLEVGIARIFNTYGPRMRINDGRAIPNFINQAIKNKDISVYGTGFQTRSFCYISDTITGIDCILNSKYYKPVNIGNPQEFSILEVAKKIKSLVSSKSKIIFDKLPEDDPKIRKPDINKALKLFNWKPKVKLEEGLIETINFFKKSIT